MRLARLEELCTIVRGASPRPKGDPRYFGGSIPWISIADITAQPGKFLLSTREGVTEAGAKLSRLLSPGTLIVSNSATVCVPKILEYEGCIHDGFVALLDLSPAIDRDYLYHYFNAVRAEVRERNQQGATQVNLNTGIFRDLVVPVPALQQQKRIAAILDKADTIRRKRDQAIKLANEFLRSLFLDLFGDPVGNPKDWPVVTLGDVAEVSGGLQVTYARSDNPLERPYLRVANVFRDRLDLTEVKTIRVTPQEADRAMLRKNDILVVEGHGNPEELGRCAVWSGAVPNCLHQNHLIRVRITSGSLAPEFVAAFLNSSSGRRQFLGHGKTTSGLNTISTSNVKAVKLLSPPMSLQNRFVLALAGKRSVVTQNDAVMREIERLQSSLTHSAFRGQF